VTTPSAITVEIDGNRSKLVRHKPASVDVLPNTKDRTNTHDEIQAAE
jgi:hypothetical protein